MSTELFTHFEREDHGGGRFTDTISIKSIAYERPGQRPRRITNLLGATGDQNFPIGVDELCQFRLDARIAGKSPLVYFGKGQSRVTLALMGANNVSGVVNGNSVLFPNAWNNSDYRLTMAGHRLQKDISLKTNHPREFTFRIDEHVGLDPTTLIFGNDFRILQPVLHPPVGSAMMDVPLTWQVSQQGGKWLLTVKLPAGDWAEWTLDPTLTLQPDATDGKDCYMTQGSPTFNTGAATVLTIGWLASNDARRSLLQFNVSTIPTSALVASSVLTLVRSSNDGTYAYNYAAFRVLQAWIEGTGVWGASADGATWNTYDGTNNWGTAGCDNTTSDRNATGENSHTINYAGNNTWSIPVMTQIWVATPASNKGVLIAALDVWSAEGRWVPCSSDHATAANRPKLVIDYILPGGLRGIITGGVIGAYRGIQTGGRL